jgi:hypothetical protein
MKAAEIDSADDFLSSEEGDDVEEEESSEDDSSEDEQFGGDDDAEKPPATRAILEVDPLKKIMERNCRCPECSGPMEMKVNTICLASSVMLCCKDEDCGYIDHSDPPAPAKVGESTDERQRSTDYAVNVLYVLSFLSCGDGGTEAARLLGLLGLPNDTTMHSRSFGIVEERMSPIIQSVTNRILQENLIEEVRLTFAAIPNKDPRDFELWKNSLNDNNAVLPLDKYPKVDASYDMAWQQRSSGRKYNSPSGHAFLMGGLSRRPIALDIKCKICNFCTTWKKKHGEQSAVRIHACTINHTGTSKAMEPLGCLSLVVDTYERHRVVVARICIDDDAATRAKLKWSNADYMKNNNTNEVPQVPKSKGDNAGDMQDRKDNGKLPGHIPEPIFVADPGHRKKVFQNVLYAIHGRKAQTNPLSTMDITRLVKNFGYMIKSLKRMTEDKWIAAANSVLDHHFDVHKACGVWCRRQHLSDKQKKESPRFYRCMTKDAKLYGILKGEYARFITLDKLKEVSHSMDTQPNESMNNTISWLAPKNKCYSGSQSLRNRICIAIGINQLGLHKYLKKLLHRLGITMTPNTTHFLTQKDRKRAKRIAKTKTTVAKKERNTQIFTKLRKEEAAKRKAQRKGESGATYKSGMHVLGNSSDEDNENDTEQQPAQKRPRTNPKNQICALCGKKGHTTNRSKQCLQYKGNNQQQPAQQQQPPNDDDQSSIDQGEDVDRYEALLLDATAQQQNAPINATRINNDEDAEVQELPII